MLLQCQCDVVEAKTRQVEGLVAVKAVQVQVLSPAVQVG